MGTCPNLYPRDFDIIQDIQKQGTTVLLIEQNANKAHRNLWPRICIGNREKSFYQEQEKNSPHQKKSEKHIWVAKKVRGPFLVGR